MPEQQQSNVPSSETGATGWTANDRGQRPQPPSAQNPSTSERDQPPTQEAVVREGTQTYEAFADQYFVQGP